MSRPHEDLLAAFEASRGQPRLFHSKIDGDTLDRFARERLEIMGGHVNLLPRSTQRSPQGPNESSGVDLLDGDLQYPEFKDFPGDDRRVMNIPCLIEHNPSKQRLKKFGVDEEREIVFHFPVSVLQEKGLVTTARHRGLDLGDLIEWDATFYIVQNTHRGSYFGQSDRFFYTAGFCNRYRLDSLSTTSNNNAKAQDP